jgi:hypothetical protein
MSLLVYKDALCNDSNLIRCFNSLRLENAPTSASSHNSNFCDRSREVVEIFTSDKDDTPASQSRSSTRPAIHSYLNSAEYYTEYSEADRCQAHAQHQNCPSAVLTDEYPDLDVDQQIAAVELQSLESHFQHKLPTGQYQIFLILVTHSSPK